MRYRYLRFPNGKMKAVTLSYDDGCREDLRFSDVITKAGLKCTFNLTCMGLKEKSISQEEMEQCYLKRGHEIAIHGAQHRAEGRIRPIEGIMDVLSCRQELEQRFGEIIRGMAYPDSGILWFSDGTTYETVKEYLKNLDIAYARTLSEENNLFELPEDWYAWTPSVHHNSPNVMDYIDEFVNLTYSQQLSLARRAPKLFYLWGHSYEFERDKNWEHLDAICEKLGGRDDIWYATNMEIYEYVNAYHSLIYSADGTVIYNPTLFELWFDIDRTLYQISPGETLKIENKN